MHCTWLSPLLTHSHAFDSRVSQAHGPWRGRGGPVTRFRASNDLRDRNSCAVRASLGKRRRQMYRHSTSSALPARLRGEQSVLHRDVCSVIHENTSSSMLNLFGLSLDTRQRGVSLTVDEPRLRSARRRRSRDATSRTVRSTHYCIRFFACVGYSPTAKNFKLFIRSVYTSNICLYAHSNITNYV